MKQDAELSGKLERELANIKDQRDVTMWCFEKCREDRQRVTAERDRLAEALQRIIEWMDKSGHNDVSLYHQATDALADVKGTKI